MSGPAKPGLDGQGLRGVTSDGAGRVSVLFWARLWRGCSTSVASGTSGVTWRASWRTWSAQIAQAAVGEVAEALRYQVAVELVALMHGVIDAQSYAQAEAAPVILRSHPQGAAIAQFLNEHLDHMLVDLVAYYAGLHRVTPEWYWRDFRLRLSRGRNHGSDPRLERADLVWAMHNNFEPAEWRSERKRHYRYPGQSPLQVAGAPPGQMSYLDALGV